ncbi:MAG: two-component system, chemotaxis family, CheB/CheR fusion protein [Mucilaginibacter sp.]|nr:two-component system, chemotaxis family, CheB/CheR fusion protein [Mucilaginibacter sp.]
MTILQLISGLSDRENRFEAANKLAAWFGCAYLVIFINDPELGILLPAPGFPQTLPDGKVWRDFTSQSAVKSYHCGMLPFPKNENLLSAIGISGPENSVAVLLGGMPAENEVASLQQAMPVLAALFNQEQAYLTAATRVALADKSAVKAEKLAATIDQMRIHLKNALIKQEKDKKDIEELMKKKDEFMNVASHELKTPITSMQAYLQILNKIVPSEGRNSAGDFVRKANKQAGKLTALINDLLDVTKIQAGQMVYNFVDLDLTQLIHEVVAQVQVTAQSHRILFKNTVPVIVHGERHRLEQVINNFLSNAIKYSPEADRVIVSAYLKNKEVWVSVRDFGIGIPIEHREFVFDRFFRVHESSKQFSGLGLGLYISAEIIRRHGGLVGVDSHEVGSEFFFHMPVVN